MRARVFVTLKNGVLDPQGKAILGGLRSLGYGGVVDVRTGKFFDLELTGDDPAAVERSLNAMSEQLLANTVIEDYRIELVNP
jgi:phosphoribosylformylglycinamidine synthase